jgi:hypothetical protein
MSNIQPKKQDLDGVEYLSANETTNIKISGDDSSSNGARIELGKDLTTTPIISHLSGSGFDFGVLGNFTFPQMVLAKEKLQAVVTPLPATDTLKINKKILLDDGTNTGTLDINGTDLEISSSGNIRILYPSWTTFTAVVLQPGPSTIGTSINSCAYIVNGSMVTARYNLQMSATGTTGNTIRITLPIPTSKYTPTSLVGMNCLGSVSFYDPSAQFAGVYNYSLTANCNGGVGGSVFFLCGGQATNNGSFFGQFPQVDIVNGTFISATITYEV